MRHLILIILALGSVLATPVSAETLVAARTIRSQTLLAPADLIVIPETIAGSLSKIDDAVGLETRVVLYEGRAIKPSDIGPAAVIDRNQIVTLVFRNGALVIATEARALGRAGVGDRIKVMNLSSRSMVNGIVDSTGNVVAGNQFSITSE